MRKTWKKVAAWGLATALTITSLSVGNVSGSKASAADEKAEIGTSIPYGSSTKAVDVPDNPAAFKDYNASEITKEMGIGWNLGNTLDGHSNNLPSETAWQNVVTTKELIKAVHDMGFNTIRIPVTWGKMINDDYSIDEAWMSRVEDIVNYAIDENMYVMINLHHDGADNDGDHVGSAEDTSEHGWLDLNGDEAKNDSLISDEKFAVVREKFDGVWKTIAERFKNYDEHLMFAAMNEVYGGAGWSNNVAQYQKDYTRINVLNQDFVDTVRATGSNNAKRWIIVQARNTAFETALDDTYGFVMPTDSAKRIMLEGHDYDGWDISASAADHTPKSARESQENSYASLFKKLKEIYVDNGIPVVVGEWGFTGKSAASRSYAFEGVAYLLKKYQLIGCIWDNNGFEGSNDNYGLIDRANQKAKDSSILNEVMRGYYYDTSTADLTYRIKVADGAQNVSKDIGLTSFKVSESDLTLKAGESSTVTVSDRAPADSDDVVLWKSDDGRIASVSNGKIVARAIGTTTITAFAQTGEAKQTIKVTVTKQDVADASTEIKTNYDSYKIEEGGEAFLDGVIAPKENGAYITYASSNTDLVTVTATGKILSVGGKGDAVITATTSDGLVKEIPVSVVEQQASDVFNVKLALHVMYNDNPHGYSGTSVSSDVLRVEKDGTYTLTFDCDKDLEDAAQNAGVTDLNRVAAVYIKDWDVTKGNTRKSPKVEGKIRYTSVKVNDTEVLPQETKNYDALNNGIFDTGNPMNVWRMTDSKNAPALNVDLNGVTKKTDVGTDGGTADCFYFDQIEAPKKLSVSFVLSGFTGEVTEPSSKPDVQPDVQPSVQPSTEPIAPPTTAPTDAPKAQNTADTLTVAKKAVVVAPKKSVAVAYQSSVTPTVSTSNKKVVTAKVNNGKIILTAPKNAVRGASAVVTVKAGSKTAKLTASVENKVTKAKAAKKKITAKKKATVKLTWNLTAQNKKKAVTDTVKAVVKKNSLAQVTNVKVTKGKAVVTLKTKKAGKTVVQLKAGKKTAKTTLIVK